VVESIAPDPEHQPYTAITIRPAAKLTQLEEVLVITATQSELSAEAQKDLNEALVRHKADVEAGKVSETAAAASARGLDLADPKDAEEKAKAAEDAAKLPPGSPPPPAKGIVPKPVPVLHPDRYSPGSVPSAEELTPGAPAPKRQAPAQNPPGTENQENPR